MTETNGTKNVRFYPFAFCIKEGGPTLMLDQKAEWKLVSSPGKEETVSDKFAGKFIRMIGKQMIKEYERNQRQDQLKERQD